MNRAYVKKIIVYGIITVVVYLCFRFILPLFLPFLFAFFLAWILTPVVRFLNKKIRFPLMVSCFFGIALLMIVLGFVGCQLGKIAWNQTGRLLENLPVYEEKIFSVVNTTCDRVDCMIGRESGTVKQMMVSENGAVDKIYESIMNKIAKYTFNIAAVMLGVAGILLIVFVSAVLILYERCKNYCNVNKHISQGIPDKADNRKNVTEYMDGNNLQKNKTAENSLQSDKLNMSWKDILLSGLSTAGAAYLKTQGILMLIVAAISTVGLIIMGNPYALIIGVFIGLLDAFPVLGSGFVYGPWMIIEFLSGNIKEGIVLLVTYVVCQVTRELLEPKLLGDKIGVKPVYTIMAMYIGLKLFGFAGFILGPVGLVMIKNWGEQLAE